MKNMHKAEVIEPCEQTLLTYQDTTERVVLFNEEEVPFPDGKLIVSRTDLEGKITHCNQSFIDMAGYDRGELIGEPHHILRHPDMPAAAFADLWKTVESGGKWHGYVKNLCKDGRYYWVYATVIPNIRDGKISGYTSVRRKPSRSKVEGCISLYAQMKQAEVGA
ncbi:MAG: Aerotaxis sensor receptor protein [uncultured Thiotrichaceae bacterium]|uniref:Aerotaxis sensor receptor protein n=1 Tax=uncultured Thiotrichaceae bacterium TaxID=298394 RepID=A0A6S6TE60_9GAMM|nr:MAG: Aerotaxis sensor receptor protein [uncultured Thiotrichaceae bacterium]